MNDLNTRIVAFLEGSTDQVTPDESPPVTAAAAEERVRHIMNIDWFLALRPRNPRLGGIESVANVVTAKSAARWRLARSVTVLLRSTRSGQARRLAVPTGLGILAVMAAGLAWWALTRDGRAPVVPDPVPDQQEQAPARGVPASASSSRHEDRVQAYPPQQELGTPAPQANPNGRTVRFTPTRRGYAVFLHRSAGQPPAVTPSGYADARDHQQVQAGGPLTLVGLLPNENGVPVLVLVADAPPAAALDLGITEGRITSADFDSFEGLLAAVDRELARNSIRRVDQAFTVTADGAR